MTDIKPISVPLSRAKIRELATIFRKVTNTEKTFYFDVLSFLELGMMTIDNQFEYIYLPKNEMKGYYGKACPEEHKIYIREDVYTGATKDIGRHRFTIMHEIAHYFLHKKENLILARLSKDEKIPKYQDVEWQANTLAAEVLAYAPLIKNCTIKEIAHKYAVSYQVARIQLKSI